MLVTAVAIVLLPYLSGDAPELRLFAAVVPAVLFLLCEIAGTAVGMHFLHALVCLPTYQPSVGR